MRIFHSHYLVLFLVLFCPAILMQQAFASEADDAVRQALEVGEQLKAEAEGTSHQQPLQDLEAEYRIQQERHRYILGLCIVFLTAVFLLIELIILKCSNACTPENILNGTGLVLIIQATVLVVLLSPTSEQLTAAIGVLAAIAGYLFGSARRASTRPTEEKSKQSEQENTPIP